MLFKIDPLEIQVTRRDGTRKAFRLISGMSETGFIISPLIENINEFASLFGDRAALSDNAIIAFQIKPAGGSSPFWRADYDLWLGTIDMSAPEAQPAIVTFPRPVAALPSEARYEGQPEHCEHSVDLVNGLPLSEFRHETARVLSLQGWMLVSAADGSVPQDVFAAVTDSNGQVSYVKALHYPRPDVAAYFGHPEMASPGFRITLDLGPGSTARSLGLARIRDGVLHQCANISIPLHNPPVVETTPQALTLNGITPAWVDGCQGHIDIPRPPRPNEQVAVSSSALEVAGWMTVDGAKGLVPEAAFITMTDTAGATSFFAAPPVPRDDVKAYFHQPELPDPGFVLRLPARLFSGLYTLGLARRHDGRLERCKGFAVPVAFPVTLN